MKSQLFTLCSNCALTTSLTCLFKMISTAQLKGFNHPETIKCSQALDVFLNKYQQNK